MKLHRDAGQLLRLSNLVIELTLAVVNEAVLRQVVLVEAVRQVLPANLLARGTRVLAADLDPGVEWRVRLVVLEVEAGAGAVVERRRLR